MPRFANRRANRLLNKVIKPRLPCTSFILRYTRQPPNPSMYQAQLNFSLAGNPIKTDVPKPHRNTHNRILQRINSKLEQMSPNPNCLLQKRRCSANVRVTVVCWMNFLDDNCYRCHYYYCCYCQCLIIE